MNVSVECGRLEEDYCPMWVEEVLRLSLMALMLYYSSEKVKRAEPNLECPIHQHLSPLTYLATARRVREDHICVFVLIRLFQNPRVG